MAAEPRTAKKDEIADRRGDVWNRRVLGETVREIAASVGKSVGTVMSDLNAVRQELEDMTMQAAETERAIGAARLDKVGRALLATVDMAELDQLPALSNAIARIEERRAKLLGLDKPFETVIHQTEATPEAARRLMAEQFGRTARKSEEPETTQDSEVDHEHA
jgi:predicted  nucleic acid-binding Zn-ribbon protein